METELAVASIQLGWLYMLLGEEPGDESERTALFDQAVTHTERGLDLAVAKQREYAESEDKRYRTADPQDPNVHPQHIRALLGRRALSHAEGQAMYVLGRSYANLSTALAHQRKAFEYYNRSLKPRYLHQDLEVWVDAHIRVANLILDTPALVNPNFTEEVAEEPGYGVLSLPDQGESKGEEKKEEKSLSRSKSLPRMSSFRRPKNASGGFQVETETKHLSDSSHFDSAITHLQLVLRSKASRSRITEIQFAIAQVNLSKLHMIIDHIPPGQSLTTALLNSGGNDVIDHIETNLEQSLERITAAGANTQVSTPLTPTPTLTLTQISDTDSTPSPPALAYTERVHLLLQLPEDE